jgi:hypothetical protein
VAEGAAPREKVDQFKEPQIAARISYNLTQEDRLIKWWS